MKTTQDFTYQSDFIVSTLGSTSKRNLTYFKYDAGKMENTFKLAPSTRNSKGLNQERKSKNRSVRGFSIATI